MIDFLAILFETVLCGMVEAVFWVRKMARTAKAKMRELIRGRADE